MLHSQQGHRNATQPHLPNLELLLRWSQIKFMSPQSRMLLREPQVRLTHSLRRNMLPALRIITIRIGDPSVGNRMHHLDALGRHLPRESLCELSHARARSAVGSVLGLGGIKGERSAFFRYHIEVGTGGERTLHLNAPSVPVKISVPFFSAPSANVFSP